MEWKEVFNYGVPTALLALVMVAIWRIAVWAKTHVVEPVVKSHLELVETMKEHFPKQTTELEKQTASIDSLSESVQGASEKAEEAAKEAATAAKAAVKSVDGLSDRLETRTELFKEIISNQSKILAETLEAKQRVEEVRKNLEDHNRKSEG